MTSRLIIGLPFILYAGTLNENALHAHVALQAIFNANCSLFEISDISYQQRSVDRSVAPTILLASELAHRVASGNKEVTVLLIAPDARLGQALRSRFLPNGRTWAILPDSPASLNVSTQASAHDLLLSYVSALSTIAEFGKTKRDNRIEKALELIRDCD